MTEKEKEERIQELTEVIDRKTSELTSAKIAAEESLKSMREAIDSCSGCLRAVKAMLQNSMYGATHRQRNFYGEAIVKFIDNSLADIEAEKDALPF